MPDHPTRRESQRLQGRVDVLVVAAHPPELSGLTSLLGESFSATVAGAEVAARAVGIGLPAAAAGTVLQLERLRPRAVVLVGTCGVYPGRGAVGDVVVADQVRLVSPAVLEGRAAVPAPMAMAVQPHPQMTAALGPLATKRCAVATTLAITTNDELAARLGKDTACHVEHLEAFAVALAAAQYSVPFAAVLGVANRVGSMARNEWLQNQGSAGQAATKVLATWLASGAGGAPR